MSPTHQYIAPTGLYPFDVRGISRRLRHPAIMGALDTLAPGEILRFVNDHDPLPLLDLLQQRYGERLSMEYRRREPGNFVIDFALA